jgi:hypothetical protein
LDNPGPLPTITSSKRAILALRGTIVPHAEQLSGEDEDQAMRVICYLICALALLILAGLLLYAMLS